MTKDFFEKLIGLILLLSIPGLLLKEYIGVKEIKHISTSRWIIGFVLAIMAGFLGGIFALSGLWFTYIYLYFGLTFIQTAATRKIIGFISAVVSLAILIIAGLVNWPVAITMFIASGLGVWIGADLALKADDIWIKRLFILVAIASTIKILFF